MNEELDFFNVHKGELKKAILETVTQFIESKIADFGKLNDLLRYFINASERGKLLRGLSVCLGYKLTGASDIKKSIIPAVAYEIFQTSILIHDDIIDKSPTRRGIESVKFKYSMIGEDKFELNKDCSAHYGLSQAICMGDIGLLLSAKLVLESDFDDAIRYKATQNIIGTIITTGLGEMLDVELPYYSNKENISENDIRSVNLFKTAQYTCTGPLQLGAILGGGGEDLLNNLKHFGDLLGVAFQIKDDLLIFSDTIPSKDKDYFADFTEGKKTLLMHFALCSDNLSPNEKIELLSFFGQPIFSSNERSTIVSLLKKSGAKDICESYILDFKTKAESYIDKIAIDVGSSKLLRLYIKKLLF